MIISMFFILSKLEFCLREAKDSIPAMFCAANIINMILVQIIGCNVIPEVDEYFSLINPIIISFLML